MSEDVYIVYRAGKDITDRDCINDSVKRELESRIGFDGEVLTRDSSWWEECNEFQLLNKIERYIKDECGYVVVPAGEYNYDEFAKLQVNFALKHGKTIVILQGWDYGIPVV